MTLDCTDIQRISDRDCCTVPAHIQCIQTENAGLYRLKYSVFQTENAGLYSLVYNVFQTVPARIQRIPDRKRWTVPTRIQRISDRKHWTVPARIRRISDRTLHCTGSYAMYSKQRTLDCAGSYAMYFRQNARLYRLVFNVFQTERWTVPACIQCISDRTLDCTGSYTMYFRQNAGLYRLVCNVFQTENAGLYLLTYDAVNTTALHYTENSALYSHTTYSRQKMLIVFAYNAYSVFQAEKVDCTPMQFSECRTVLTYNLDHAGQPYT